MYKNLRILFTILAAICLAVVMPVTLFLGWTWSGICILCALLFFGLMLLCKQAQEKQENPNGFSDLPAAENETNETEASKTETIEKNTTDNKNESSNNPEK